MKYLLFGYHDNRPINKYFLLIFAHFGLKTASILNTHKNYRCKVSTLSLGGMIALLTFPEFHFETEVKVDFQSACI